MKLTVNRDDLVLAVNTAAGSAAGKTSVPVLLLVLLNAETGNLVISGSDLNTYAKRKIPAEVETPGAAAISASILRDVVSTLPEEEVEIYHNKTETKLYVKSGKTKISFPVGNVEHFPLEPKIKTELFSTLADQFRINLDSVAHAATKPGKGREALEALNLRVGGGKAVFGAADGLRMARRELDFDSKETFEATLPISSVAVIDRACRDTTGSVKVYSCEQSQVAFLIGHDGKDIIIYSQVMQARYPDISQVIPKESQARIVFRADLLLAQMKTVDALAKRLDVKYAEFTASEGELGIFTHAEDDGDIECAVEAKLTGPGFKVPLNTQFVKDAILGSQRAWVSLSVMLTEGRVTNGIIVRGVDGSIDAEDDMEYTAVIMPMVMRE